jgi:hypothetical protein
MNPAGGRGYWGRGRGSGRGWRNRFYATGLPGWARAVSEFAGPVTPTVQSEQELVGLKEQSQFLQNALGEISKRIEELEKAEQKK